MKKFDFEAAKRGAAVCTARGRVQELYRLIVKP